MSQTVLVYASQRQRTRLTRQGYQFLAEYQDYVLTRATSDQVDQLRQSGYEVEIYRTQSDQSLAFDAAEGMTRRPRASARVSTTIS